MTKPVRRWQIIEGVILGLCEMIFLNWVLLTGGVWLVIFSQTKAPSFYVWAGMSVTALMACFYVTLVVFFYSILPNIMAGLLTFVFLEVFLVTLVIHNLLLYREKQALIKKMNMVIGAFFSEVGRELIKFCIAFDVRSDTLAKKLVVRSEWTDLQFTHLQKEIAGFVCDLDYKRGDLEGLGFEQ